MDRAGAQVRSIPRRINEFLKTPEAAAASMAPGAGEAIDAADIIAGLTTGDLPRSGWGALGLVMPGVGGATMRTANQMRKAADEGLGSIHRASDPTRFTTGRGSRYVTRPGGTTERLRIEDEGGIYNLQPRSHRTYYMTDENARRFRRPIQQSDPRKSHGMPPHVMATHPAMPGRVGVRVAGGENVGKWNPGATNLIEGDNYADFLRRNQLEPGVESQRAYMEESMVPYETEPRVGLRAVEAWVDPDLPPEELIAAAARRPGNTAHFSSLIDRILQEGDLLEGTWGY